ncbi:MAG: hypothetical protein EKK41_15105 [Hyphomicrobiales bacterium]|nr:MAG: hypothetical protein EKK41_15105 [Hyphomicrobiales bacterium]
MTTSLSPKLQTAKRRLLAVLKRHGIALVEIDYDGEEDNGQILSINTYTAASEPIRIDKPVRLQLGTDDLARKPRPLHDVLDDFAWMLLREFHEGFEDNDGAFGTIKIDVPERRIYVDHNARINDYHQTVSEV